MHCKIVNNAGIDLGDLEQHVQDMYAHFDNRVGFKKPPVMVFDSDPGNETNTLGKTAYYDPQTFEVHVYVDGRHPKDMLRSIAHELIHHQQNLEGRLDVGGYQGDGYYLKNKAMRSLEQEAMLNGNRFLREYEDQLKLNKEGLNMSTKDWKNKELFENLAQRWGFGHRVISEAHCFGEDVQEAHCNESQLEQDLAALDLEGGKDYAEMSNPELTKHFKSKVHYKIKAGAAEVIAGRDDHPLQGEAIEYLKKQEIEEEKTPKYDDNPGLEGGQKTKLPDALQKAILNKKGALEEEERMPSGAEAEAAAKVAKMKGEKPKGKKVEEATETYSADLDFMKKYLRLKGYKNLESRKEEKIKQLYTQSLFSRGLTKPSLDDLEKMGIERVDEILGVAAMAGGAAALVALVSKIVGMNQDQTKKFEAFLEANPTVQKNLDYYKGQIEIAVTRRERAEAQKAFAKYSRAITLSDKFRDFEPKKVDETSAMAGAGGGVQGYAGELKESLENLINEALTSNKKIRQLLKGRK
tara:strand:- start:28680 stop:30248 length:1569 start_codon:yes stop_codon:yes gene_type:complete